MFCGRCAYCGESGKLQIEHLLMFNRKEYGLHHPGNIVPCCTVCNKRERRDDKSFMTWEEHLRHVCEKRNELNKYDTRLTKIQNSMRREGYPDLNENERHSIRVIANSLYENVKSELAKSLELYKQLDEAFVQDDCLR